MAENYGVKWTATARQRAFLSLTLSLSLLCGMLLTLQLGCQEEATNAKAPVMQKEPEKIAEPAPTTPPGELPSPAGGREVQTTEQVTESPEPQSAAAAPKIELEEVVYDFGEIGPDTKHTARFKFRNAGNASLKIARVKTCCGVVSRGVQSGQEYGSGETGMLELDYGAGSYPGSMRKNIYLQTNDPEQNTVTLTIKAKIVRRVDHKPERLKLFLRQENAGCSDITLTSLDGQAFSIAGFRCTANAIAAEFDPAVKATTFVLKPKADLEKLKRSLKGQISIDLTHPECSNVRLLYDVLPEFTINPPQIMLFNLTASQPVQREIWVLGNYQDDFEIESVSSQKGTIKLVDSKKVKGPERPATGSVAGTQGAQRVGTRYQLRLEITPPPVEGKRAVLSDVLEVKIKGGETLSIQCRGFYRGS